MSISNQDLTTLMGAFDLESLAKLNPDDYVGFGMKDSVTIRRMFTELVKRAQLTKEETSMVVTLATVVRNKRRILDSIGNFKTKSWHDGVVKFFNMYTCQYVYMEKPDQIAVVHITSCMPFLAGLIWAKITPPENRTCLNFLKNVWSAQFNFDDHLMNAQFRWESNFWNSVVTKGGDKYEPGGFKADYWITKSADSYPLITKEGKPFPKKGKTYSRKELAEYLESLGSQDARVGEIPNYGDAADGSEGAFRDILIKKVQDMKEKEKAKASKLPLMS